MKIGLTGYKGRVGKIFLSYPNVFPLECDVTNPSQVEQAIQSVKPDLVVHLAAKSDVDYCQDTKNEQEVIDVNFFSVDTVAEKCQKYGSRMVMISSDHVFSGKRWWGKYKEKDDPQPVNFYGLTKMTAEGLRSVHGNLKVVRTSSLFDDARISVERGKMGGADYPVFMKRSFLHVRHFSQLLYTYCQAYDVMPKMLHLAGVDSVSYFDFMCDVFDGLKIDGHVRPRRHELEGDFAPRGHNLGLDVSLAIKLGFHRYSYLDGIQEMTR